MSGPYYRGHDHGTKQGKVGAGVAVWSMALRQFQASRTWLTCGQADVPHAGAKYPCWTLHSSAIRRCISCLPTRESGRNEELHVPKPDLSALVKELDKSAYVIEGRMQNSRKTIHVFVEGLHSCGELGDGRGQPPATGASNIRGAG